MNTSRRTNTRAAGGIAACRRHPRRRPRHTAGPRRVPATKRPRFMDDWVYAQISAKPVIPADPPPQTERDVRDHGSPGPRHG